MLLPLFTINIAPYPTYGGSSILLPRVVYICSSFGSLVVKAVHLYSVPHSRYLLLLFLIQTARMYRASLIIFLFGLSQLALSKDVHLYWNITWVIAAPDGFARPVVGINGKWPCPQIDVELGDRLIVDLYNGLGNQSTGIHWHGFHQYGTGYMDGSTSATQCPVAPGQHIQYNISVNWPIRFPITRFCTKICHI
jgi:Multicopper oxidase